MDFNFIGGTAQQQEYFLTAVSQLLNFSLDKIEATIDIDFSTDPNPDDHNEFATTYPDELRIVFRTDAPDFGGLDPDGTLWGMPFFTETVAHELGHLIFTFLPDETQETILAMFDSSLATADDGEWVDQGREGVAETFKDAFLPRRFRRYANRTNRRISIRHYAEFRRLFREAQAEGEGSGGGLDVPAYDFDLLRAGDSTDQSGDITVYESPTGIALGTIDRIPGAVTDGDEGLRSYLNAGRDQDYIARSDTGLMWMEPGTTIECDIESPGWDFFDLSSLSDPEMPPFDNSYYDYTTDYPPEFGGGGTTLAGVYLPTAGVQVQVSWFVRPFVCWVDPETGRYIPWDVYWALQFEDPPPYPHVFDAHIGHGFSYFTYIPSGDIEDLTGAEVFMLRSGVFQELEPGATVGDSQTIPEDASTLLACEDEMVLVRVIFEVIASRALTLGGTSVSDVRDLLPSIPFEQPAHPACPAPGYLLTPQDAVPVAEVGHTAQGGGSVRVRRGVAGATA